ncbi:uncharacterized protein LOC128990834 [Macrosteles quadrilineatus]|uniref:uncharacterized protein LOC128990834 n=1 Tax=Macrosteles quadrilineatus TaxID=74068 RepID=UPI0023E2AF26|nr:uncharacterized protein LOC128990834 [Macrosteles quadrilineatus]
MTSATSRYFPFEMKFILLILPVVAVATSSLPPEPVAHLTPPQPSSPLDTLIRRPRNDSSASPSSTPDSDQKPEAHQQEARAILWAAPTIPILSSHRGRSSECNPCDRVPWVPMARALNTGTHQYALSIPTIQLTLPVNYGLPMGQMRPPQYGPPPPQNGPPPQQPPPPQYGPPPQHSPPPPSQYGPPPQHSPPPPSQYGPPPQNSPPPPSQYGPPTSQYGPPPQHSLPSKPQYGPPPQNPPPPSSQYGPPQKPPNQYGPPTSGGAKVNGPPSNHYGPPDNEKDGLPPPPLPQRFLSPSQPYGPPQPQTQHTSSSNNNPTTLKVVPPLGPSLPNQQLLPAIKYGPPFNTNVSPKQPPVSQPQSSPKPSAPVNMTPPPLSINNRPHQYRGELDKRPSFGQNPIPFPFMSKSPLPPLFNYQTFNDGKQDQLHPFLQPPKPQNVVVTITETEDNCKKCLEHSQPDSEPAPAEHVTENVIKSTENFRDQQKPNVQVVKSVPLAEYLASVEYPMQIVQAPILDVPDLTKYFDLGYHNFPQFYNQNQNPSNFYTQPNPIYVNHNLHNTNGSSTLYSSTTGLDNVELSDNQLQTTNSIPHNHKPDENVLGKNQETTEKGFTSSSFLPTTVTQKLTTRPSQIFHISKKPSTIPQTSTSTTTKFSTSQGFSTSGHYVTSSPTTEGKISPKPTYETLPHSLQDQILSAKPEGSIPPVPSDLRFLNPPPVGSGAISDWTLHSYGRGWGTTPPQPFAVPTPSPQNPRFAIRPTPAPSKKGKLIHQIIVPYTTNKHQPSTLAGDPQKNVGWTPLPPTSQGRKVPSYVPFESQFSSTTGLDQPQQNLFPSGNFHVSSNVPLSASGSDNLASQQIPPSGNGPLVNLPPHVINQILHLNQPGTWPSGPEELQQLLVSNLQGLLRGEEDSVDIARLQKNIDNWTAEGYKQNSPSVNFIPVTPITHIFNSKKIPDEYLTSTEPSTSFNTSQEHYETYRHNFDSDHEGAESQKHQVKVHPETHSKDVDQSEDTTETVESLLNSWSLLDTKMAAPSSTTEEIVTQESQSTDATSKVWEKIQVSISPLTNEKVYVVTPVPVAAGAEPESSTTVLSTRVERSYSVVGAETPSSLGDGKISNKH